MRSCDSTCCSNRIWVTPSRAPGADPRTRARARSVKALSPQEASELLRGPSPPLLLDIRPTEGAQAALPVAPRRAAVPWLVPCVESSNATALHHNPAFVDEVLFNCSAGDESIVVIDSRGLKADAAAHELADSASRAKVYYVTGGLRAWAAAGLPVEGSAAAALSPPGRDVAAGEAVFELAQGDRAGYAFKPKLLTVLGEGYNAADLRRDVLAGLSVGVIALSLSMALGIASESTPAAGLYTAVAAGFVISALGGSRVAIGGPTAAFIPIVVGVAHEYGPEALVTCTAMSGMMLIAMGVARLGSVITAIPRPVVTGFTGGIAVFIFSTQIKDFLGLHLPAGSGPVPSQFLEKVIFLGSHLDAAHLPSLALSVASLGLLRLYPAAWAKVVPPQIVVVAAATAVVAGLDAGGLADGIETIGSRFGMDAIPSGLPAPSFTLPSADTLSNLVRPSFTIALLAAIESLLCAVVADGMIDDKHDSSQELVAQGLGNLASAALGGLPATGALARTAANVRSGGRSPVSGMVAAAVVLAVMAVAAPVAARVPLPALAAVLVSVALNMGDWKNFRTLPALPDGEAPVYLLAFSLTILTDVTVAVEAGLVLSVLLYLRRIRDATDAVLTLPEGRAALPDGAVSIQLTGALLFGAVDKLEEAVGSCVRMQPPAQVLLLDCAGLIAVDATGLEALEEAHTRLARSGCTLVLAGLRRQPHTALSNAGLLDRVGFANVVHDEVDGAARVSALLSRPVAGTTQVLVS